MTGYMKFIVVKKFGNLRPIQWDCQIIDTESTTAEGYFISLNLQLILVVAHGSTNQCNHASEFVGNLIVDIRLDCGNVLTALLGDILTCVLMRQKNNIIRKIQ